MFENLFSYGLILALSGVVSAIAKDETEVSVWPATKKVHSMLR